MAKRVAITKFTKNIVPISALIISPGVEDDGIRGLGKVTVGLVDALKETGFSTSLLTGAPIKYKNCHKDNLYKLSTKRLISHYISEGIKSEAFKLNRRKMIGDFVLDLFKLFTFGIKPINNNQIISTQFEPYSLRSYKNVDNFINFSLFYKASKYMPTFIRSVLLNQIAKSNKIDLIITSSPFPIKKYWFFKNVKIVQSLHDIMPLTVLETPPDSIKTFSYNLKTAINSSDLVITSSSNAKDKLLLLYPDKKVEVVYVPCVPNQTSTNNKFDLKNKYILFMSALEKRKNVTRLIEAFNKIGKNHRVTLVLVGSKGYGYPEIEQALNSMDEKIREHVIIKGYISEDEKWVLLNNASLIVHTSIDEGLGIPVIESLIAGKPVVSTNLTSVNEFAPSKSMVFIDDPYNVSEIADKIDYAINNLARLSKNAKASSSVIASNFSQESFNNRLEDALRSIGIRNSKNL